MPSGAWNLKDLAILSGYYERSLGSKGISNASAQNYNEPGNFY
jgi:hypothetical protein